MALQSDAATTADFCEINYDEASKDEKEKDFSKAQGAWGLEQVASFLQTHCGLSSLEDDLAITDKQVRKNTKKERLKRIKYPFATISCTPRCTPSW